MFYKFSDMKLLVLVLGLLASSWAQGDFSASRHRRGAAITPAAAGGYNIGNKGSTLSVSSALGAYNSFRGNVGVDGAYGAAVYDLGAALGTFGPYLNEAGGGGYGAAPGAYSTGYGFGGPFYANKGR